MTQPGLQKHIRCVPGDVGRYVLLPGDPARSRRIAEYFENPRLVAENREYTVFTGTFHGIPVSVCSTGIGGPSASIAIEELIKVGADTFIRVGSAGARQEYLPIGDVVVVTGAYRGEGTSQAYLPVQFPAIADLEVTNALLAAAREQGEKGYHGLSFTRDAYYVQDKELNEKLKAAGVMVSENECATLFVVASARRARCGAIVGTDSNIWLAEQPALEEKDRLFKIAERKEILIALRAIELLASAGAASAQGR